MSGKLIGAKVSVSVAKPSRRRSLTVGANIPYSTARSRSSSNPFSGSGAGWGPAELYLTDATICYELLEIEQKCEILLEDLLGVHVIPTPLLSDGRACRVDIHIFPIFTKKFTKKKIRRLADVAVLFDREKTYEENFRVATEWKKRALSQADIATRDTFEQGGMDVQSESSSDDGDSSLLRARNPRSFLVFINPMAGVQRGESSFYTQVKPMFDLAEIKYDVRVTSHQNHAHEMIQTMDLSAVDAIVIGSGDGLLYEVINGIMKRPDWERIIKIPVGMLPLGSGNALVASTLHEANEVFNLETAAFQIIRGGYSPLDLTTIHTSDGGMCYMALLGAWGLVADVDIESEKIRKIGEFRFFLGAMNAIRKKKVYRGRLSYLVPVNSSTEPKTMAVEPNLIDAQESAEPDNGAGDSDDALVGNSNDTEELHNLDAGAEDGSHIECSPADIPSQSGQSYITCMDDTSTDHHRRTSLDVPSCQTACIESRTSYTSIQQNLQHEFSQPLADLLVPLSSPLPDTWITKEEDFINISFMSIPFLNRSNIGDPNIQIGSGKISLVWIDGAATRLETLKVFTNSETGKHVEMDQVKLIDTVAFRIEPITSTGIMTVDGEQVSYGPIQGQVHPHMGYVMSRKRKSK